MEKCPAPFGAAYVKNRWKDTGKAAATLNLSFRKPVKPQRTKNRLVTLSLLSYYDIVGYIVGHIVCYIVSHREGHNEDQFDYLAWNSSHIQNE